VARSTVVKLGFGLVTCQRYPGDSRSDADLYREALELAEETDRLGFDAYWLSEHHFVDDAYMPSLLTFAAAVAARTERIEVATGVVLAPLHDPLRLAEDAATVDLVSGGRLLLGVGLGWRQEEFEALGIEQRRLGRRLEEIVEALRQSWSDGLVTAGVPQPVAVTPKPARPDGPPIWIGGSAEPAVRRAGRIADGYLASRIALDDFAERCGWLREELERSERDPSAFGIGVSIVCFPWPDPEEGWRLVRDHAHYLLWKYADMAGARARTGPPPPAPPLSADDEQRLRAAAIVATPEQVAERIRGYAEAAGDNFQFVARAYFPGLDPQVQREVVRLLAEDVAPLLR
jgi:alkanesulfonate monooxygenase SsuD/methylene tetrahydromethanopterin reductase-like flavin-dependent oxidoreductase (luciferase family)